MTLRLDSPLFNILKATLHSAFIDALAKLEGVVIRQRKVDIVVLVWTVVLGFSNGANRTLTSLRRTYEQMAGHTLSASSFQGRLNPKFTALIKRIMFHLIDERREAATPRLTQAIGQFRQLLALDTTILQLHDMLARKFPSTQPGQAAAKLHVVFNILDASAKQVKISAGKASDQGAWNKVGGWVQGCLLLFDLGYYNFHLFWRIDAQGGYFLSRLKSNANPLIVRSLQPNLAGRPHEVEGRHLQDVLPHLRRRVVDVEVEIPIKLRRYQGKSRVRNKRFRVVGIRNEDTGRYHLYMTNIWNIEAQDFGKLYALRWQIELLFKGLRSQGRLDHLPSQ